MERNRRKLGNDVLVLHSFDIHEQAVQSEHALLQCAGVFSYLTCFCGGLPPWFTFDHDIKVDEFLCKRRHVVLEAKGIFSNGVGGEHVVTLSFPLAVEKGLLIRVADLKVDIE